jgi:hypothetical protein|tara:strand:- start:415 stop:3033 length:2619 start_codon:yes stop_codon:yes gene_type:complete
MQTETKLDYLNKKYTHKINDLKTDEERKKAAQIMLDKSREILTEEESIYHKNRLFIESRLTWQHKGKEIDQYKVREYNTHNVRSEAKILYFRIPGAKGNYVEAYDRANSAVMGAKGKVQNLYEPQTVNISYDEYCDEPVYKKSLTAKRYKDGLLLVIRGHAFVKKKGDNLMMMLLREDYEENNITGTYKILKINQETLRANSDIDWNDKCFDNQLVLYIIDPDVHKTKGVKIIIRKNSVNRNIHKLRRLDFKSLYNKPWELIGYNDKSSVKGKTSFLINDFWKIVEEANWFLETLVEQQNDPKLFKILMNLNKISKKELLSIGWKASLIELFNSVQILADMLNNNLQEKNNNNFFNGITHFDRLSEKEYMKAALEAFYNFKDYNKFMLSDSLNIPPNSEKFVESFNTCFDYCRYLLLKARVLLFDTDQGTSVNKMSINTEEMSETDCLLFWRELELCDYVSASMHQYKRCPLMFRDDKVINNMDILDPLFIDSFRFTVQGQNLPKVANDKIFEQFKFEGKHILQEAMEQTTGYCFHESGYFQIRGDEIFKGLRFREDESRIYITILDKNERYISEIFDKKKCDFLYTAYSKFKLSPDFSVTCMQDMYMKIASVIRDFKVVIERDRVLGFSGYRTPKGLNTSTKYYVYLPRVSYKRDRSKDQVRKEKEFEKQNRNFVGSRRAHVRKLPDGYKSSKVQMLLAKKLNVYIPPNYTYVKESKYGENGMSKREIVYRSKSLNGIFYYTKSEKSEFDKINGMSPAGFEEYCHKIIEKNGWKVYKNNPIDGGIDVRALKDNKNGSIKTLLVQCKHWRKPIPPGAIRDFKAGADDEKVDGVKELMFISFSKFSPGAKEYALKHNIILVDGDDLIERRKYD